jgi:sulfide:quinone oxidoreductase
MDDLQSFRAALDSLPGPILAYCRSGARSSAMFEAARKMART